MRARVVGLGQSAAGDDGVGLAVVRALSAAGVPSGVEVAEAVEDSALIPLLENVGTVVIVDAVLGAGEPGRVLRLTPEELRSRAVRPISTHGIDLAAAIELARTLAPATVARRVAIVGVAIARAERYSHELSPAVAAAVPRAVEEVRAVLGAWSDRHA